MKWGIDVSKWQGNFDFATAKKEGVEFAILKAGGGDCGLYKDGKFERNYSECSIRNIPVGAYFFGGAMDTNQALKEAEYFCKLLKDKNFVYKVWYDVEAKMLKAKNLPTIVITFIERMRAGGFECGIYASESTLKSLCKTQAINNYPHWVAKWTVSKPTIPTEIWQFGGEVNKIRTNKVAGQVCDQNYYLGQVETKPAEKPEQKEEYDMPTIKNGSRGKAVKIWQIIIGCNPDGVFGPITRGKTTEWQRAHGLVADGIVGPRTWKAGFDSL